MVSHTIVIKEFCETINACKKCSKNGKNKVDLVRLLFEQKSLSGSTLLLKPCAGL